MVVKSSDWASFATLKTCYLSPKRLLELGSVRLERPMCLTTRRNLVGLEAVAFFTGITGCSYTDKVLEFNLLGVGIAPYTRSHQPFEHQRYLKDPESYDGLS